MALHMQQIKVYIIAVILAASMMPMIAFADDSAEEPDIQQTETSSEVSVGVSEEEHAEAADTAKDSKNSDADGLIRLEITVITADGDKLADRITAEAEKNSSLEDILMDVQKERNFSRSLTGDFKEAQFMINGIKQNPDVFDMKDYHPQDGDMIECLLAGEYADAEAPDEEELFKLAATGHQSDAARQKAGSNVEKNAESSKWDFGSEWAVVGLARDGKITAEESDKYCKRIAAYVKNAGSSTLSSVKSSDNSKVIISLASLGYDATDVNGVNLLEPLADLNYVTKQGINGPVWALLAFDSHAYKIPVAKEGETQTTREALVDIILKTQLDGKGWAYSGTSSDVDMTCMALQALTPYYNKGDKAVDEAVDNAILWLSTVQDENGIFSTGELKTSESCSQVIVALSGLGINPNDDPRFIKNGNSAVDGLLSFKASDGGFIHAGTVKKSNALATQQGYYALVAFDRMLSGSRSLFDMSDTELRKFTAQPDKGDTGSGNKEDKTAGKYYGKTRSLGFLSLGLFAKDKSDLITESDGTPGKGDALSDGMEYNALEERARLNRALPWIYMSIGALAALALVVLLRERSRMEQ